MADYRDTWIDDLAVGVFIHDEIGDCRVMAIAEGWVMLRRPRAMPFCKAVSDIYKTFNLGKQRSNLND